VRFSRHSRQTSLLTYIYYFTAMELSITKGVRHAWAWIKSNHVALPASSFASSTRIGLVSLTSRRALYFAHITIKTSLNRSEKLRKHHQRCASCMRMIAFLCMNRCSVTWMGWFQVKSPGPPVLLLLHELVYFLWLADEPYILHMFSLQIKITLVIDKTPTNTEFVFNLCTSCSF
jgi:hypothetical protein